LDSLPPPPPAIYADAPGDIYPRDKREHDLCESASHPDYIYLGALLLLDAGAFWGGVNPAIKYSSSIPVRFLGPTAIGLTWGATVGGLWLALPKCSLEWVAESPREGVVRSPWPLAFALALLAGATAPVVNAIAFGNCTDPDPSHCINNLPARWSTFEREMHIVAAGVAGFGGALLPYLIPPRTLAAARELDHIRFAADNRGAFAQYSIGF
jgi:hypothetical protein